MVIFKSKRKQSDGEAKLKLSCKRLFPSDSVKYLGIKIDGYILSKSHIDYFSVKLNRVTALLFEIRNLASNSILKIYNLSIFESHLYYCLLVWSQSCNAINQLVLLQKNSQNY